MNRSLLTPLLAALCLVPSVVLAENWPGFRGPSRQGISTERDLPLEWSATEHVAWKTPIPGAGWSSPIVWDDRVFVTTTTDEGAGCHVLCLDATTGRILWDKEVFRQIPSRKEGKNSYASSTPVTDGERVYAVFADGSLVALDFEGNVVWTNRDHTYYSKHGLGASPILYEDLLIMPFDGSSDGANLQIGWKIPWDRAFLLALDKHTGEVRWKGTRGKSRIAHVTPNVLEANGQTQIVSGAGDAIQGFDPETGERIWTVYSQGEGVTPSIVIGDGLIFTCSGFEKPTIRVVRPGGRGDVTETHIAWEQTESVPSLSSLLYVEPYVYSITDKGVATCYEAATGDVVWQGRIGGNHSASPVYADGKIYFLSEQGETTIIEAGPEFKIVARNNIGEKCQASIAVSQGRLFIRSDKNLYCIRAEG
jgi:outer membrane protein assembly factor BamB